MEEELSAKEIRLAVLTARITAPGVGDDEFAVVVELQRRLKEPGYLEIVQGISRQEKEFGVPYRQSLEFHSQITKQNERLKAEVAQEQEWLAKLRLKRKQASIRAQETEGAAERARIQREKEEKELTNFKIRAEAEERQLIHELEKARKEAKVSLDEISLAGRIKAETESRGLSLEQALNLCREFTNGEKDCKRLVQAIERSGSLSREIASLEESRVELEKRLATLKQECQEQEQTLTQLKGDVAYEADVHRFYRIFKPYQKLMEYISSWDGTGFRKCVVCGARSIVERGQMRKWSQKGYDICPCCGYAPTDYDIQAHSILGWPPGSRIVGKIFLGE